MAKTARKYLRRKTLHMRVRKDINGTAQVPRLSVYRSNKEIYAQLIDDVTGTTLTSASSRDKDIQAIEGNKSEKSVLVGKVIAQKALDLGIESCKFDRGGFLYHGRVKSLADGAREAGLKF